MNGETSRTKLLIPALAPLYDALAPWSYPIIRFFTGLILMPHGAQKLFGWFGGKGLEGTAAGFSQGLGLEPGLLRATVVGLTEFVGGLFVAVGFLTRPAVVGIVVLMAVAVFQVYLPNGFFWGNGGYEYPLPWGLVALAIALRGGAERSIDRAVGREF